MQRNKAQGFIALHGIKQTPEMPFKANQSMLLMTTWSLF